MTLSLLYQTIKVNRLYLHFQMKGNSKQKSSLNQ